MGRKLLIAGLFLGAASLLTAGQAYAVGHSDGGCSGCHLPHHATLEDEASGVWGVPLWSNVNLDDAALPVFQLYNSTTLDASLNQPNGPSKLCLGCHDGTNSHVSEETLFSADTGLKTSHPISFQYTTALATTDGGLYDPTTHDSGLGGSIKDDLLDSKGYMQCTSCHDVHATGIGDYLLKYDIVTVYPDRRKDAVMCRVCHIK